MRHSALVLAGLLLCGLLAANDAQARKPKPGKPHSHTGPHAGTRIYFGTVFSSGVVIHPRPFPPSIISTPAAPTVYVEKKDLEGELAAAEGVWYFCSPLQIYYPYTPDCPEPWTLVTPPPESSVQTTP